MDYTVLNNGSQAVVNVQKQLSQDVITFGCKSTELFNETERKENNNYSNLIKTEVKINQGSHSSSLFSDNINAVQEQTLVGMELFCEFPNYKEACDLNISKKSNSQERTIFDDAEYFSKNYSYKLLPFSFENVDETIIHSEHNYCNVSQSSSSETEEDCSRTMDYDQVKEKNYKKRKSKFKEDVKNDCLIKKEKNNDENSNKSSTLKTTNSVDKINFHSGDLENALPGKALDVSAPLVQEEKTENSVGENTNTTNVNQSAVIIEDKIIVKEVEGKKANLSLRGEVEALRTQQKNEEAKVTQNDKIHVRDDHEKEDSVQFDSDKENQKGKSENKNLIEVTITRGDGKNNYQPCDSFLNDIAKLVPKIVKNDCNEIDILDRTCDKYVNFEKHRLYYVISESTWQLFQNANERVILTNDRSLGQPVQNVETNGRPTYLIFDQFSLAKCLADYCKEIGGCFEYKFVEEEKDVDSLKALAEAQETRTEKLIDGEENSTILEKVYSDNVPSDKCQEIVMNEVVKAENTSAIIKPERLITDTCTQEHEEVAEEYAALKDDVKESFLKEIVNNEDCKVEVNKCERVKERKDVYEDKTVPSIDLERLDIKGSSKNVTDSGLFFTEENTLESDEKYNEKDGKDVVKEVYEVGNKNSEVKKENEQLEKDTRQSRATIPIKRKRSSRSSSSNASIPAVSSRKKNTVQKKKEENNAKNVKMNEGSPVRTRSKSASETEFSGVKYGKRVTSQRNDSNSDNDGMKGIKRTQCHSVSLSKSNEKSGMKQKRIESPASFKKIKRKTRTETGGLSTDKRDKQNKSNKGNRSSNTSKKSDNSIVINSCKKGNNVNDGNKISDKKKMSRDKLTKDKDNSSQVNDDLKKELPKNLPRGSNKKFATTTDDSKEPKGVRGKLRNKTAPEIKPQSQNLKNKSQVSLKRTRGKEDLPTKILPKRKR